MTNRERLFRALAKEETDRVPVWLLFPYHQVPYYGDVRGEPSYRKVHEESLKECITLNRRPYRVPVFSRDVLVREEHNGSEWERSYTYNSCVLTEGEFSKNGRMQKKPLLTSEEELETFLSFPILTDEKELNKQLEALLPKYMKEAAEFPENAGAMMLEIGEPINVLYHSANLLEFPIWSLTHGEEITQFLDRLMVQKRFVYTWCLERELADVYFLVGSELAAPPMVSLDTFQSWIVPYARELVNIIRGYGKRSILHFHGQIKELLNEFSIIRPDGLHTIEAPPVGNCTLSEAFQVTEDNITLIGNIQYDEFRHLCPDEMKTEVRKVLAECKGHPFILSPSAGPYQKSITTKMEENYLAFISAAVEH